MIDHEKKVFDIVAKKLRTELGKNNIYIIGEDFTDTPPKYPSVSIVMTDNKIRTDFSTFNELENVVDVLYKVEVVSNLKTGGKEECKKIMEIISDTMKSLGIIRTFNQPIFNLDTKFSRRIARFTKRNEINY